MKQRPLGNSVLSASIVGLGAWVLGGGPTWGQETDDADWNDWFIPVNRQRVLDLLASWKPLTDKYACTLAQLVIAWTAAQPGVTHVLAGGRNLAQVVENAKAGELTLMPEDLARIRRDVVALGEPAKL